MRLDLSVDATLAKQAWSHVRRARAMSWKSASGGSTCHTGEFVVRVAASFATTSLWSIKGAQWLTYTFQLT